jgi:hypothetical protein
MAQNIEGLETKADTKPKKFRGDPLGRNFDPLYGYYGPGENESYAEAKARIAKGSIASQAREQFAGSIGGSIKGRGVMGVPYRRRSGGGVTGDSPLQTMKTENGKLVPTDTFSGTPGLDPHQLGGVWREILSGGRASLDIAPHPRKSLMRLRPGESADSLIR